VSVNIPIDYAWIEATGLAAVRFTAFLFIAPPFAYNAFPARIKAMLAVGLAIVVSSRVTPGYESLGTGEFFLALTMNVLIGALLGFLVMLCFTAIQAAGNLIDLSGGFQMSSAYDPNLGQQSSPFGRLFQMTALLILFVSDGYQLVLSGFVRSFDALPVTGSINLAGPVTLLIDATSQMLVSAVQIAGPIMIVLFLADAGLGLMTRVAPALNAFAMGFPLKILLTLTLAGSIILALPRIVGAIAEDMGGLLIGGAQ